MKTFYLIIAKDKFHVYHKNNNTFVPEYIDGNPYLKYDLHHVNSSIQHLVESLQHNYNLETMAEVNFIVVNNSDPIRNSMIENALNGEETQGGYINSTYDCRDILAKAIRILSKEKKLHVSEFGINYDGDSYVLKDNILKQGEYNLLAYTINQKNLINYCL